MWKISIHYAPAKKTLLTFPMNSQFKAFVLQKPASLRLKGGFSPFNHDKNSNTACHRLPKGDRSAHIHDCIRREIGLACQVSESSLRFCYECMKWLLLHEWRDHCTAHLQSWRNQHCEVVRYRHTVIRPAYCPFCLWNLQAPAEERLQYWTRSGNLREHIESQHMPGISWPTKESICGYSQIFENERELRHHLHDVHGLKDTIWRNPKPPRKRKRIRKVEVQFSPQKPREESSKKARFYRYPPPRQEHDARLSDNIFIPIPTVKSFIAEYPQEHYYRSEQSSSSSKCSSMVSYSSTANSPRCSRPTTPVFDFIDPRILEPSALSEENDPQTCDDTEMLDSHTGYPIEVDGRKLPLNYISQRVLPAPTTSSKDGNVHAMQDGCAVPIFFIHQSTIVEDEASNDVFAEAENDAGNEIRGEITVARDRFTIPPPFSSELHKAEDGGGDDSFKPKKFGPDPAQFPSDHSQNLLRPMRRSNSSNLHRRLNARDRRKLLALKGKKMTLRQVGPQFTHLDTDFLRQVWGELKPSERCTRSRTIRK